MSDITRARYAKLLRHAMRLENIIVGAYLLILNDSRAASDELAAGVEGYLTQDDKTETDWLDGYIEETE